jgi:hypothetical protein
MAEMVNMDKEAIGQILDGRLNVRMVRRNGPKKISLKNKKKIRNAFAMTLWGLPQ